MPREPRDIRPGGVYHLISRFVDRDWFIRTNLEREYYLRLLGRALTSCDWMLLAYAIMSNHIHLAAIAGRMPLDQWIRRVHSPFADSMNRSHGRIGTMFVRGPKAGEVPAHDVGELVAYIHNNPVRAGVCQTAADTDWTSHRAFIGRASAPPWLHAGTALSLARISRDEFDAWVAAPVRRERDRDFTEEAYEERKLQAEAELRAANVELVDSRQPTAADVAETLVILAAATFGISVSQIRSASRGSREISARAAVVHAATKLGLTGAQIARALAMSQQRVSVLRRETATKQIVDISGQLVARAAVGPMTFAPEARLESLTP